MHRAADHFADAHAVADHVRYPVLPPLVDLWHGKHLPELAPDTATEGEVRLRCAAAGFAALKAPLHEILARRWLAGAGADRRLHAFADAGDPSKAST